MANVLHFLHFPSPKFQIARSHHPTFLTTVTHSRDQSSKITFTINENLANVLHFWPFLGQSRPTIANRSVAHSPQIWRMYRIPPIGNGVRPSDFDTTDVEGCSPSFAPSLICSFAQSLIHSANRSPTPSFFRSLHRSFNPRSLSPSLKSSSEQRRATTSNDNDEQRPSDDKQQPNNEKHQRATTSNDEPRRATPNKARWPNPRQQLQK